MDKRQGIGRDPNDAPVTRMARPPAQPHAPAPQPFVPSAPNASSALGSTDANAEDVEAAAGGHPLFVHHDRVSAAHAAFIQSQEQVHLQFLAHRQRLLEWLAEAGGPVMQPPPEMASVEGGVAFEPAFAPSLAARAPVPPPAAAPVAPAATHAPAAPEAPARVRPAPAPVAPALAKRAVPATTVSWDDWLLDAYVFPIGALFAGLGRVTDKGFGTLAFELRNLGSPALPGDTVVADLRVGDAKGGAAAFRLGLAAQGGARPIAELVGQILAAPFADVPRRGPAADAAPERHHAHRWTTKRQFNERDLAAIHAGEIFTTFGAGFERSAPHTRTPPLPGGRLARLSSVVTFDPTGGPWSLGLLRAHAVPEAGDARAGVVQRAADEAGLRLGRVYQGAEQSLAFFVLAAGDTIARDGWRFEIPAGHASTLRFAEPPALDAPIDYELVVESFDAGPWSTIIGDVRAWSGDRLVLHAERVALRLVADFPLTSDRALMADGVAEQKLGRPSAEIEGFKLNYSSMLAGATGRPTEAFNQAGAFFETGDRTMPRLPGAPYHFVTRVTEVKGDRLSMKPGAEATMEYDVPVDAWYFDENGNRSMPWCVLLEAALQPCGWLSVYVGCPLMAKDNVYFRNLDGAGQMTGEVFPGCVVRTHAKVTSVASVSGMMLISYKIECFVEDRQVCKLTAAFGYFPDAALDMQGGLPTTPEQRALVARESNFLVDFTERPPRFCDGALRIPGPMLLMADRVTGYWPDEGPAGKGRLRAEKTVKPSDWFFRAHFYSDPVQPGSLGVEMMLQLLQFHVIDQNLHDGLEQPYFEPLPLHSNISWRFRGQVRPENKFILADVEIVSIEKTGDALTVLANGSLWVDGVRCYEAKAIGVRVRAGRDVRALPPHVVDSVLDPAIDRWVTDHRPSYTVPVMPMMSLADRLAGAALAHVREAYPIVGDAPDWRILAGDEIRAQGWLIADRVKHLRTEVRLVKVRAVHRTDEVEAQVALFDVPEDGTAARRVASGRLRLGRVWPAPPPAWASITDGRPGPNPYESGSIFWGPRLQLLRKYEIGASGLSAELDAGGADAPIGTFHPILLDGALHGIPHDELELWSDKIAPGLMAAPVRLSARFFGPPPEKGVVRAEVRFAGFDGANAFPTYNIQMLDTPGRVWATLRHVEMLIPFGHRGMTKKTRIPFLVQRKFSEGAGLSEFHEDHTELRASDVKRMDGLPGSVAHVYELERDAPIDLRVVAIKDHVGQKARVHPGQVTVATAGDFAEAWTAERPSIRYAVAVEQKNGGVIVRDASPPSGSGEGQA